MRKSWIITLGATAGALVAIGGLVAMAAPIIDGVLESGPLPVPSRVELAQVTGQVQALQQGAVQLQKGQTELGRNLDLNTLSNLNLQLLLAQHEAGPNPNLPARQYMIQLRDQINVVRRRLGLPPIQ